MKKVLFTLSSLIITVALYAQPAFKSIDMPNIGDMDTILNYPFTGDINNIDAETGNGYTWDFSSEFFFPTIYNVETYRVKTDPISTPYTDATIEHFSEGTSGTSVSLYDYSNDTMFIYRIGIGGSGTSFIPPIASINFPINFNQTSDITWPLYASGNLTGERRTTVLYDGFGTLSLPGNRTFSNVFRVKKIEIDSSYILNTTTTYLSYIWYKQGGGIPLYKITSINGLSLTKHLNNSADVTTGVNNVNKTLSTSAYPNPTNGQLKINSTEKIQHIEMYDMQGKQIKQFTANTNVIDLAEIENGAYFLKIHTNKSVNTIKVFKK